MRAPSVEFVAVVLAASTGARLFPLTSGDHPKHLLPVGGIPLLARLLSVLHDAGFTHVVVGVASDDNATAEMLKGLRGVSQEGSTYLFLATLQITLSFLPVDCAGSAEALRIVSDLLPKESHILVLPGDFVVLETSCLIALVNAHRRGNTHTQQHIPTACTVLLVDTGEQDEHGVPIKEAAKAKKGGLARDEEDIEYIGLSVASILSPVSSSVSVSSPRLVWKQSKIDVEQDEEFTGNTPKLLLPKPRLRCGTVTTIRMDWSDVHAYIFSPWVRHLWTARSSLVSVQGDLVPLLVGRQWRGIRATFGTNATIANVEQLMEDSQLQSQSLSHLEGLDLTKEYAVRAHVLHGSKVMRASTIPSYLHAGREVIIQAVEQDLKQDQDQNQDQNPCVALPDGTSLNVKLFSAILKGAELGDKVQCKLSTIGHDVKISAKCRLNNVIVMDHVTVGENCVLQNSILGEGCIIGENCNLNDCQVPPGKVVPAGTKEKGESFMDVDDAYR